MWMPRFAYNKDGDILYIKQENSVAGTWQIPEIFSYKTETRDFGLAGVWVEYSPTTDYNKVNNMKGENNSYGFMANTIGVMAYADSLYDSNIVEKYVNSIVENSILLNEPTNKNRSILKIINTNKPEPIKAKAYYDEIEAKIKIEVIYTQNGISKIINSRGEILSENLLTADTGDEVIGNKVYKFIVIDNLLNLKQITVNVTGLDIYIIENEEDLKLFQNAVNNRKTTVNTKAYQIADVKMNEGKYEINSETGDITFAEDAEKWIGITSYYYGKYYGNNHTISGIYGSEGLFSYCDGAEIRDLGIINSYITPSSISGAIIESAKNNTILENCYSEATIKSGYNYIGGLIGKAESGAIVRKCYNKGKVSGGECTGGLIGYGSNVKIEDSYNVGAIKGYDCTGGISGFLTDNSSIKNCCNIGKSIDGYEKVAGISGVIHDTTVSNCYNVTNINGSYGYVAGIAGEGSGRNVSITKCYNIGNITGSDHFVAGIVGTVTYYSETNIVSNCYNKGNVEGRVEVAGIVGRGTANYCYNTGEVTGSQEIGGIIGRNQNENTTCMYLYNAGNVTATSSYIGGIIGMSDGTINHSYNIGNIISSYRYAGGIVGYNYGTISYCYNSGLIDGKSYAGGIAGSNSSGSISGSYYKTDTASKGTGSGTDSGAYVTDNMPSILSVVGSSYFKNDSYNINNELPILSWQTDNDKLNLINGNNAFVEDTEGINNGYPLLAWQVKE